MKVGDVVRATKDIGCDGDVHVGDVGVVVGMGAGHHTYPWRVRFFHQTQKCPWVVSSAEIEHAQDR